MNLYEKTKQNPNYLKTVQKIERIQFITDGKWDWEHGLAHYERVAYYVHRILIQLDASCRMIELGMTAALLHDIGLSKRDKKDHAVESARIFDRYLEEEDVTIEEKEILRQAILDHSNGNQIQSLVGLALVLADKLDVTYHRTINSSIQDTVNREFQKVQNVDIEIQEKTFIVKYDTTDDFDVNVLKSWKKALTIPMKVAAFLQKEYKFFVNDQEIEIEEILHSKEKILNRTY